jgi:hypothetical protein
MIKSSLPTLTSNTPTEQSLQPKHHVRNHCKKHTVGPSSWPSKEVTLMLSLCSTNKPLCHEGVRANWCIDLHFLDLCTSWSWAVSFMPRPLYRRGKSPQYPLDRRLGGPLSRSGRREEEKMAIPTTLSRLLGPSKGVSTKILETFLASRIWAIHDLLATHSPTDVSVRTRYVTFQIPPPPHWNQFNMLRDLALSWRSLWATLSSGA